MRFIAVIGALVVWLPAFAWAQDEPNVRVREAVDAAIAAARPAATEEAGPREDAFETFVARQASLEVQLALRFYAENDDFRAVTALRRYQFLDGSSKAAFLSALMIGQIYHRNDKPELALLAFEDAARAAERPYDRTFAYLMALQEACLPLSYYAQCNLRLEAMAQERMEPQIRELVEYQLLYTDVVLRADDVTLERVAVISDPALRDKVRGLVVRSASFEDLPLKSAFLAGTLSAVLPGAGQLYNGRPWDALLAFLFAGAFGTATYFAIVNDSPALGVLGAVLTAGFYSGNIVNAVTDAKKINAERYLAFFEQLKVDYWPRVSFRVDQSEVLFSYAFDWPATTEDAAGRPDSIGEKKSRK